MAEPLATKSPIPAPIFDKTVTAIATATTDLTDYRTALNQNQNQNRELDKIGDHFKEFVERALNFVKTHQSAFPPDLDAAEKLQAFLLFEQCDALADQLEALALGLRNTFYVAGAVAKAGGLQAYGLMDVMGRTHPMMSAEYRELKKFFPRGPENPKPTP